jgi:hypothetical protein
MIDQTDYCLVNLKSDLSKFGLNPVEWSVFFDHSQNLKVRAKDDRNFMFRGQLKKQGKRLQLQKLELISL